MRGQPRSWASARRFTGTPWSPIDLPNLLLWARADRIDGLSDGDNVSSWVDLSGNGNHLVQATADLQPIYKIGIVNGRAVVRFDGINDILNADPLSGAPHSQPNTCFLVAKQPTLDGASNAALLGSASDADANSHAFYHHTSNVFRYFAGTEINGLAENANFNIFMGIFNGASSVLRTNGNVHAGNPGTNNLNSVHVASWTGGSRYADCDVAEIIICTDALSIANYELTETYLSTDYDIGLV